MATPVNDTYSAASGVTIYGGMAAPGGISAGFDAVTITSESTDALPGDVTGNILVLDLHGSSGGGATNGRQYRANVSGLMAYSAPYDTFKFSTARSITPNVLLLRPVDNYGTRTDGGPKESMWLGFKNMPTADVNLITFRRVKALITWAEANLSNTAMSKRCMSGGSMGAWGVMTFGLRSGIAFAALYPDRPRWRYNNTPGHIAVADWNGAGWVDTLVAGGPNLTPAEGGTPIADMMDLIAYVADTTKKIPWIGWCVGRGDGYTPFSDHIAAVAALRAAKRGFAFAWNNGDHSGGSQPTTITRSYPYGTFEIGKGYPLFTNHSGDQDPAVDAVGGINIDLKFRNVSESAAGWSCDVTSLAGARTVTVEPISEIFTKPVSPQNITIPAANSWVTVNFA
jgi:hypothetical protein